MKGKEIVIGGVYAAKVSGKVQPVKVEKLVQVFGSNGSRTFYTCRNIKTGREITVKSPMRFRYKVSVQAVAASFDVPSF